ncbi:transposable element Tcb1 transposase [Trichonephila clavipes]|nr:transposable element Tcb1 transposase [Trichonephila clavipes]
MEAGWSARRVARQLGRCDYVVRRCWDQWIQEMSFTRRPGYRRLCQTNRRDDRYIVRSARVQTTASSAAIQAQPARPPDLSPIEHICNHLGWRVGHPTSLNELEARLQQIWNEMSQDIIQNLNASMPDRIASCIRVRGDSTGLLRSKQFRSSLAMLPAMEKWRSLGTDDPTISRLLSERDDK